MRRQTAAQLQIGISGWTYPPWRGVFYPDDLTQARELDYASRQVNSIEINGTFYSLQRPSSFQKWYDATPPGFVFSLKGGRYITHIRRLKDVKEPLATFLGSGILGLKEKLGVVLWQLPPNFVFNSDTLAAFLDLLPGDTESAAKLAKKHGKPRKTGTLVDVDQNRPIRYAIEVRNESFAQPEFIKLLREHNVALVVADTAGKWPYGEDVTADFVYARLHGDEELYASGYTAEALDAWAEKLRSWKIGKEPADAKRWSDQKPLKAKRRDLFVYFDNDVKVRSPFDAMSLAERLGPDAQGVDQAGKAAPSPPRLSKAQLAERVRLHMPGTKSTRGGSKK